MYAKYKRRTFLFSLRDSDSDYIIATVRLEDTLDIGTLRQFFETKSLILCYKL